MTVNKAQDSQREPKDLRYRRQYFPGGERLVFKTADKGFVPLPIILRKLLKHISASELRVLVYLQLRASKYGICYPTLEEMAFDLGLGGRKNLTPHLKSLLEKHFISVHTASGRRLYLVHDPRIAIEHMASQGKLNEDDLYEINELYDDLHQLRVVVAKKPSRGD